MKIFLQKYSIKFEITKCQHGCSAWVRLLLVALMSTFHATNVSAEQLIWPTSGEARKIGAQEAIVITGEYGDEIFSPIEGVVAYQGVGPRPYGNIVIVQNSNGLAITLGHLLVARVTKGELVKAGQTIGVKGLQENGQPGLFLDVRVNGKPTDPLSLLPAKNSHTEKIAKNTEQNNCELIDLNDPNTTPSKKIAKHIYTRDERRLFYFREELKKVLSALDGKSTRSEEIKSILESASKTRLCDSAIDFSSEFSAMEQKSIAEAMMQPWHKAFEAAAEQVEFSRDFAYPIYMDECAKITGDAAKVSSYMSGMQACRLEATFLMITPKSLANTLLQQAVDNRKLEALKTSYFTGYIKLEMDRSNGRSNYFTVSQLREIIKKSASINSEKIKQGLLAAISRKMSDEHINSAIEFFSTSSGKKFATSSRSAPFDPTASLRMNLCSSALDYPDTGRSDQLSANLNLCFIWDQYGRY